MTISTYHNPPTKRGRGLWYGDILFWPEDDVIAYDLYFVFVLWQNNGLIYRLVVVRIFPSGFTTNGAYWCFAHFGITTGKVLDGFSVLYIKESLRQEGLYKG